MFGRKILEGGGGVFVRPSETQPGSFELLVLVGSDMTAVIHVQLPSAAYLVRCADGRDGAVRSEGSVRSVTDPDMMSVQLSRDVNVGIHPDLWRQVAEGMESFKGQKELN